MTPPDVPPGVPVLLSRGDVVKVTGLKVETVKRWLKKGVLKSIQPTGYSGKREVYAHELARFADSIDLPLNWDALQQTDPKDSK